MFQLATAMYGGLVAREARMNLLKLKKLANARLFSDLTELWVEAVSDDDTDQEELLRIVGQVAKLDAGNVADELLITLLEAGEAEGGRTERLRLARDAAVHLPASAKLRQELHTLYPDLNGDYDQISALCETLIGEDSPLDESVQRLERFLKLRPGAFLRDRRHLDPGLVESVDGTVPSLYVSFAGRHYTLGLAEVDEATILPEDHFLSLLHYRPEILKQIAADSPEDFLVKVLQYNRDRTCSYKDLRKHFATLQGDDAWADWWKKARPVLKTSGRIEVSGASQPSFRLMAQERSYEDRLRGQFRLLKDPAAKLEFTLDYLDISKKERDAEESLLVELGNAAARLAGPLLDKNPPLTLACLAVHSLVAERGVPVASLNPKAAVQVIRRIEEPARTTTLLSDRLLVIVLEFIRVTIPENWSGFWARVLPRSGRSISDLIARELIATDQVDVLADTMERILDSPTASIDVLCWFWRARHADSKQSRILVELPRIDTGRCLLAMLEVIDSIGRMAALSDDKKLRLSLDQALDTLALYDSKPILDYVAGLDIDGARYLKEQVDGNGGLRAGLRATITAPLRTAYPEIYIEASRPWDEDVFYTTELGLQKRQDELDRLVKIELPAVAKQIGEAASHGDLSENAEYTAALEKRDQITSNATRIEGELVKARVIEPEMSTTDFVNVGTRVSVRDLDTEQEESFAFLGVWDSDPGRGVLSYRAPLSMAFMGAKAGETIEFGDHGEQRRWEVLGVEPAI